MYYASISHSYTYLILALGIVRELYGMSIYYLLAYMTLACLTVTTLRMQLQPGNAHSQH